MANAAFRKIFHRRRYATDHTVSDKSASAGSHPYGSRSLSAQVAVINTAFSDCDLSPSLHPRSLSADLQGSAVVRPCRTGSRMIFDRVPHQQVAEKTPQNVMSGEQSAHNSELRPTHYPTKRSDISHQRVFSDSIDNRLLHNDPQSLHFTRRSSIDARPRSVCSPILTYEERRCSLSRKPTIFDLRNASAVGKTRNLPLPTGDMEGTLRSTRLGSITRARLNKPLPPLPLKVKEEPAKSHGSVDQSILPGTATPLSQHLQSSAVPAHCKTTEDTTIRQRWLPNVTHETVTRRVHELREEQIIREIHNHHVFHRTLPVIDVDLLPPRHFLSTGDGLVEIQEDKIPVDARPSTDWLRSEIVSKLYPVHERENSQEDSWYSSSNGRQEQTTESATSDGIQRVESTCVHRPRLQPHIVDAEHGRTIRVTIMDGSTEGSKKTFEEGSGS